MDVEYGIAMSRPTIVVSQGGGGDRFAYPNHYAPSSLNSLQYGMSL
jgi:hypothetical protein